MPASAAAVARDARQSASLFAALGDERRLSIVGHLGDGAPRSITQLTRGSRVTRQAITKHLRVLEGAGLVKSVRCGRESLYTLEPAALATARSYLERVCDQWDDALSRLQNLVEE